MIKHRNFPSRLPGTNFQFTIRRAVDKKGATPIIKRERFRHRKPADRRADEGFLAALIEHFGEEPFERGNLDAGRLSWLIDREVLAIGDLDPVDYEQMLRVDLAAAQASFPLIFQGEEAEENWSEDTDEKDQWGSR
ncbi:hypothetical protein [Paracoccus tegillarcae]|uniref:Uncharacterized protein n=1 Tax=Paracoccus tegillarcae TaxID=1529068 RepID=A0A2K9ESN3_9RHOB|nr:hypothetical protein [Paracoccus tegillarcae]AUH32214.1 hypothetical protein CUV01_01315 [Paracoccus tegillarcae]